MFTIVRQLLPYLIVLNDASVQFYVSVITSAMILTSANKDNNYKKLASVSVCRLFIQL